MFHTRTRRLISVVAMLALLIAALGGALFVRVAHADSNRPQTYLALGDSIAFGMNPLVNPTDASNFIGYPKPVSIALKETLTNAACPGETSGHFISLTNLPDNGCASWRANFPLHIAYSTSQLDFADSFLKSHPQTLVVSIALGSNDLLLVVNACHNQVSCILGDLPPVLDQLAVNLNTIYYHIRTLDGYHHKLVALTYYTDNYSFPADVQVISAVNQVLAERTLAWGGVVADGFGAFAAASAPFGGDTCAAGLRIVLTTNPLNCDLHPSPAGRALLAQAVLNALRPD